MYKHCIDVNMQQFKSAIIETVTHILFTANDGVLYDMILDMYRQEHNRVIMDAK